MGETNDPIVRRTISNGELEGNQCTETGVNAPEVNQISVEYALNGMCMVTDISKEHEFKILGKELLMVLVTYMEENNDNNHEESKPETLAAKVEVNESRGLTRDMKKTKGSETWKWKKNTKSCETKNTNSKVLKRRKGGSSGDKTQGQGGTKGWEHK